MELFNNCDDFQICLKHESKNLVLFCVDHQELGCDECRKEKHKKCKNVMAVETACIGAKQSHYFLDIIESLTQIAQGTKQIIKSRIDCLKSVEKSLLDVTESIDQTKEKIVKQIENLKQFLLDLQRRKGQILSEINKVLEEAESIQSTAMCQIELFKSIRLNGTDYQAFLLAQRSCNSLTKNESRLEMIGSNLNNYEISFKPKDIDSMSFWKCEVKEVKSPVEFISSSQKQAQTLSHIQHTVPAFKYAYDIDLKKENVCIRGVLSTETKVLLIDSKSSRILVYDEKKFVNQVLLEHKPWDCALIQSISFVAVTCHFRDMVKFVDLQKQKVVNEVKIKESAQGGIAATDERIYVGTKGKLCVLTTEGQVCGYIETTDQIKKALSLALGSAYIYLADKNTIHCISLMGELVFSYKLPSNVSTVNIAVDKGCSIYTVTDSVGLHVLSYKGDLLGVILSDKDKPYAIDFNLSANHMYFSWKSGTVVSVYNTR